MQRRSESADHFRRRGDADPGHSANGRTDRCAIIVSCAVTDKVCHAAITFSEECISKITETGYLIYGYAEEGNKNYFKEATKETGYKVSKTRGGMRIQAHSAIGMKLKPFVGKYDMRIDQSLGYVFIDKRRMK